MPHTQTAAPLTAVTNRCFPPLLVAIYRHGELVRTVEFPDPREAFVRAYNEGEAELEAVAVDATLSPLRRV